MMDEMALLKSTLNKRCVGVNSDTIYFENGVALDFHIYEVYVYKFDKEPENKPKYFSPSFWKHKSSKPYWSEPYQTYHSAGDEAEPFCSKCSGYLEEHFKYCPNCGNAIDWEGVL